jgi:hypothetical protein
MKFVAAMQWISELQQENHAEEFSKTQIRLKKDIKLRLILI